MKENEQFPEPLQYAEIKQISKSIAKWVWQRFSIEGKKEWHAKKGAKGGSKSKGGGRPSLGEPWKELGISRATYFRRKNLKNETKQAISDNSPFYGAFLCQYGQFRYCSHASNSLTNLG